MCLYKYAKPSLLVAFMCVANAVAEDPGQQP
jgi:hypothetical protein